MKIILTIVTVALLMLTLSACSSQTIAGNTNTSLGKITDYKLDYSQTLEQGKSAPLFQFQMPDGQTMMLSDLKGKTVLINFWQVNCPYCVKEMPYIEKIYQEHKERGLVVLAINVGESSSKATNFLERRNFTFPVIMDFNITVSYLYNARYLPTTYIIDKAGNIVGINIGAFRSTEALDAAVKTIVSR